MLRILIKIYRRIQYLISTNRYVVAYFGNTLGFSINKRWKEYHFHCRRAFSKSTSNDYQEIINQINFNGMGVIGQFNCSKLSQLVSMEFNKIALNQLPSKQLSREICGQFSQEIFTILDEASPIIESYYESFFQPYWISIQENYPGVVTADTSFGWHLDDNPRELLKVFLYLNDVTEKNGAFRAFPLNHSKKILQSGFISHSPELRIKKQSLVSNYLKRNPNSLVIMEGKAGTLLVFDNNLVHRGTPPVEGYRRLIQIEIYPALKKFTYEQVYRALVFPIINDYPRNPYVNEIAGN